MKIASWNVNGIVACRRKGFLKFLASAKPDILCCQEIKTQVPLNTPGYLQFWNPAKQKGYSGTLVLSRRQPISYSYGFGIEELDDEGRLIALEYPDFYLLNVYVPSLHVHSGVSRPDFRAAWDKALLEYVQGLTKPAILCGDFNVVRTYIDSYPENEKNKPEGAFFQPDIQEAFENLLSIGLVDVFRAFYPNKEGAYTWWGPKNKNRADNRGNRLDYFLASGELLTSIQSIKFHTDVLGSDHCPISMVVHPAVPKQGLSDEDMAVMWRTIDWSKMELALLALQRDLALAAYHRDWALVHKLQSAILHSWSAKVLAVRTVVNVNSEAGVDGVRWKTDAEKMRAARSLNVRGYRALPYRRTEIEEKGKQRVIHVPVYRDKAMLALCAFALDPVSESTADKKSFFSRKGRSTLDLHAYLEQTLAPPNGPDYVVIADLKSYYSSIIQRWLLSSLNLCDELNTLIQKLLKAGVIIQGELFDTDQGISLGTSLSPILGNMLLDGLQSRIYDRLYPNGNVDYLGGNLFRFADDILVTARSRQQADQIMQIIMEFVGERGLRLNYEKSYIKNLNEGFTFLSRHYQRKTGQLIVTPSDESIIKIERELNSLIMNYKGTQRKLIEKINDKLSGWAGYHRSEDAYMVFRHIDAITEAILINRMCRKHPSWHRETILNKFWIKDGTHFVFALPDDPTVRVTRLASLPTAIHKPCKVSFNPYLDQDYYMWIQGRRNVQKANGKYRAVWERQEGRCAYCGHPMLPDEEIEVVEKEIGRGRSARNLAYIHRRCSYNILSREGEGEHIDAFELLDGLMDSAPPDESPYLELTEFFRHSKKTPISLTFHQIEEILGEELDWEARTYAAFWYDDMPGRNDPMWEEEHYPFNVLKSDERLYCIADSWLSQGYQIKTLHLADQRIVFRRIQNYRSSVSVPKAIMSEKLPDTAVREFNNFCKYFMKKYGL